jgi:TFIIF-interacting CTD phosphatase-like protein
MSSGVRPVNPFIIPDQSKEHQGMKTLVLDLDETLIHSSTKLIENPDLQFDVRNI